MNTLFHNLYRIIVTVFFTFSLALLTACGGGGGGGDSSGGGGGGTTPTTISGTALAPNGVVAQLSNQTFMYALNEFLFPSARADITGLDPVPGALVELIEVNDAGVQVGPVLASTSTSITGDYHLDLPAGVNLAANLVVRITGTNVDLRAMVVETKVDINPLSEFLLRKFITKGVSLATLNVSEVASLSGHAAQFDVAATADLSTMLTALESQLGSFVDNSITAIDSTAGTASTIAGDYHHGSMEMGFDYTDDSLNAITYGSQRTTSGTGQVTLLDDGGANVGAIDNGNSNVDTLQLTGDNLNYYLNYYVNDNQGGQVFHNLGSVDSGGNLSLIFPFQEDLNTANNTGERRPPTSAIIYASGVAGLHFDTSINTWATYRLNATQDAVDPGAYIGHKYTFALEAVAPQASGMNTNTLAGNYGSVNLVNFFPDTSGTSAVYSGVNVSTVATNGDVMQTQNEAQIVTRTPTPTGTATFAESTDTTLNTGTISVSSNGQFTYTENGSNTSFFGFVSSNAEFVLESVSDSSGTSPITDASNGLSLSVRLPTTAPNLDGHSYRLMGIEKWMDTSGRIEIARLRGDDDRLTFNNDGTVTLYYNGMDRVSRNVDNADYTLISDTSSGTFNQVVTIANDGAISFTLDTTDSTREFQGFVSASTDIIILRSIERAKDASAYATGLFVAIPVK
jgi:hypothetical protein